MPADFARILRQILVGFIALCCALVLVWAASGKVRADECGTPEMVMQRVTLAVRPFGIVPEFHLRPDGRLLVVRLKGAVTNVFAFRNGCFDRPVDVPILTIRREEA